MNNEFRQQIYNELNLRETDDLLDIWQENNHFEWSDDAFEVISKILKARGVEIPEQDAAKYKQNEAEDHQFSDEELKIIDDENPPDFYDPFEVLRVSKWLGLAIKLLVGLIIIQNLLNISTSWRTAQSYFAGSQYFLGAYPVTFLIFAANIAISVLLAYFPLKFLSQILRILMEMEFRSRKAN